MLDGLYCADRSNYLTLAWTRWVGRGFCLASTQHEILAVVNSINEIMATCSTLTLGRKTLALRQRRSLQPTSWLAPKNSLLNVSFSGSTRSICCGYVVGLQFVTEIVVQNVQVVVQQMVVQNVQQVVQRIRNKLNQWSLIINRSCRWRQLPT